MCAVDKRGRTLSEEVALVGVGRDGEKVDGSGAQGSRVFKSRLPEWWNIKDYKASDGRDLD